MIRRIDRIATELPPPSDPDPAGAAAVQELMGGRFGEMSTFLNYTFQSFNFRNRQGARPFYDLDREHRSRGVRARRARCGRDQHDADGSNTDGEHRTRAQGIAGSVEGRRQSAPFPGRRPRSAPQNSQGRPWNGDYIFSSGDLVEDLTHNFFLETGAQQQAQGLGDGRASRSPSADRVPARSRRRSPGRLRASDRAVDRRGLDEALPDAAHSDGEDPGVQAAHRARRPPSSLPLLAEATISSSARSSTARIRRRARISSSSTRRRRECRLTICPLSPRSSLPTTRPKRSRRSRRSCA